MTRTPLSDTGKATDKSVVPPPSAVTAGTDSGFLSDSDDVRPLSSAFGNISGYFSSAKGHCRLYKAERLGKWYILKCLKKEYADNPLYQSLLWKEFEVGYRLSHPHIAQTYGMEEVPGCGPCIVMEYVDGENLGVYIQGGRLTRESGKRIVQELCDALAYIHQRQIVHRDLKPENILITRNGQYVKLIDFGFSDTDSYAILKAPAGTRKYAAPEMFDTTKSIDTRADIYALGMILKEMRPSDSAFQSVGKRCCREQTEQRPAYVQDIPLLLERCLRRRRTACRGSLLAVLLSLLAVGAFLLKKGQGVPQDTIRTLQEPSTAQTTGNAVSPSVMPEGKESERQPAPPSSTDMPDIGTPVVPAVPIIPAATDIPAVDDFLGASYTPSPTVYGQDQHGLDMSYTLFREVSDKMLAAMRELHAASSKDSLLALLQTLQSRGGLREQIRRELYQEERDYQQAHHLPDNGYYEMIDYKLDQTYARLKGLFRPLVASKIAEFYPASQPSPLNERTYQHASVSAFRHFCRLIEACDTMQSDSSLFRFQTGYWKHEACTESLNWLSEHVSPESALYSQCEAIIRSSVASFGKAYGYLLDRKSMEMQERLGQTVAVITQSEELLPDGTVRKRTLKDNGTWRMEEYDPATLKALGEE